MALQVIYPIPVLVTIPVGTSISGEIDVGDFDIVGLITPSTFDGTTVTFTSAPVAGGTYVTVAANNTAATAYTVTTTASIYTPIDPIVSRGLRFIKLNTGSSQSTTDTIITLVTRKKK